MKRQVKIRRDGGEVITAVPSKDTEVEVVLTKEDQEKKADEDLKKSRKHLRMWKIVSTK